MTNPPTSAGIWIRVSDRHQSEDNQLPDCEDYCEEQGYLVKPEQIYRVHGKSAWKRGKLDADKQAILKSLRRGDIKVVVVWSVDRWSRGGIADLLDGMSAIKEVGGRVEFVKDSALNVPGPAQELLLAVLAWVAKWESEHRSDRTRNGMDRRRAEGAIMGGSVPFGYRLEDGQKLRDEVALATVKEIFERSARGESTYTIAEFVKRAGYYRRDNTIPDILRNPVYIADGVVSGALAQKAVAALESRRTGKVRRIQVEDYSGMIWCRCGRKMHRIMVGGMPVKGIEPTRYYRCREHPVERDMNGKPARDENGKAKTRIPMVRADDTDALVDIIMSSDSNPWLIEVLTGGDTREADKGEVWQEIEKATKRRDMAKVIQLNAEPLLSVKLGTIGRMAYDASLARRIRDIIGPDPELTEKKMFGGLAFLVRGHLAISASGQGGVMFRADPERTEELTAGGPVTVAVMRGREMPGWLRVSAEDVATDDELSPWVEIGIAYARSLPPKLSSLALRISRRS